MVSGGGAWISLFIEGKSRKERELDAEQSISTAV
jgi:hypothetical protein